MVDRVVWLVGKVVPFPSLFYKRVTTISMWKFGVLVYPVLLLLSGLFKNIGLACVVAVVYEIGFAGMAFLYTSSTKRGVDQLKQMGLGCLLIFLCYMFLEVMYEVIPGG